MLMMIRTVAQKLLWRRLELVEMSKKKAGRWASSSDDVSPVRVEYLIGGSTVDSTLDQRCGVNEQFFQRDIGERVDIHLESFETLWLSRYVDSGKFRTGSSSIFEQNES
jgi:hypothetical protein